MTAEPYKTKSGEALFRPIVSGSELMQDRNTGFCLACGAEAYGVEPDARKYRCEGCNQTRVYGLEQLVLMGIAKISADDGETD